MEWSLDPLLITSAVAGLLSAGFVLGEYFSRRRDHREVVEVGLSLKTTLERIQATHNQLVVTQQELGDRLGAVEMSIRGSKGR
jgi:ethanolamine utilization protein EutA (predicted chaperonin)